MITCTEVARTSSPTAWTISSRQPTHVNSMLPCIVIIFWLQPTATACQIATICWQHLTKRKTILTPFSPTVISASSTRVRWVARSSLHHLQLRPARHRRHRSRRKWWPVTTRPLSNESTIAQRKPCRLLQDPTHRHRLRRLYPLLIPTRISTPAFERKDDKLATTKWQIIPIWMDNQPASQSPRQPSQTKRFKIFTNSFFLSHFIHFLDCYHSLDVVVSADFFSFHYKLSW